MGKNDNRYKNLRIKVEDIEGIINAWGIDSTYENVEIQIPEDMSVQTLNFLVNCDGKVATLAVFPAKGGVCTISPNFGKEKEISALIADYIVDNCGKLADSNPYKSGLSIDISQSEFDALYGLLKDYEDVIVEEERQEINKKFFARLRSQRYGDSIVITYYNTGKLVIQGKPLELFYLVVELISEKNDLHKFVNAETKSAGLNVNGDDVISDMKSSLGRAYDFLGTAHKAILSSAYVFLRTEIIQTGSDLNMDYSGLFFPAARALEGYIFKLLVHNNVLHEKGENLGYYFKSENDSKPLTLHSQYVSQIDNDTISYEINRLYKLYHKVRHQYAHATENDATTAIIPDRKKADKFFEEIVENINKSYEIIIAAKKREE